MSGWVGGHGQWGTRFNIFLMSLPGVVDVRVSTTIRVYSFALRLGAKKQEVVSVIFISRTLPNLCFTFAQIIIQIHRKKKVEIL